MGRPAVSDCQDRGPETQSPINAATGCSAHGLPSQSTKRDAHRSQITLLDVVPRLGEQTVAQVPEDFVDSSPQFLDRDFPHISGERGVPEFRHQLEQVRWNDAQSPEPSVTGSCQPLDLIRSGFWRVRRKQKSRPRQYCSAPHSRAARRSEVARRAGQSRVSLCTGWARIVDDAEDMVDSRAIVEKQRPIRSEAVEQFLGCGLSGYLGTCHEYAFETSRLPLDQAFDRGEGRSISLHLK